MQSNEYNSAYDDYNDYQQQNNVGQDEDDAGMLIVEGSSGQGHASSSSSPVGGSTNDQDGMAGGAENNAATIDFNDPKIASLPRILLMGPRRGGKTSIQVCNKLD